ncbi:MAG: hypothetical protein ACYC35_27695 [Pirellulales bacterium]
MNTLTKTMKRTFFILTVLLLAALAFTTLPVTAADPGRRFSVMDYGAKADGVRDDSPSFKQPVEAAIAAPDL